MKVTFSAAAKGHEYEHSLTKTLARKSPHVSMSGKPQKARLILVADLTRYGAILKFEDCCFKDYCSVNLRFYFIYGKTGVVQHPIVFVAPKWSF